MSLLFPIRRALARPYGLPLGLEWNAFARMLAGAIYRNARCQLGLCDPLTRIASKYPTDKGVTFHPFNGYTSHYDALLRSFRDAPITLLEIGLSRKRDRGINGSTCPSLLLWAEYFPKATILGFDLDDFTSVRQPRTTIFRGDQGKPSDLLELTKRFPRLDVVIDDGSHASYHQQVTLKTLWPCLSERGIYIIEDLDLQPDQLESSLPPCPKTRDLLADRSALERFISPVGDVRLFDSPLRQASGTMACLTKQPSPTA